MRELLKVARALSDANRVKALCAVRTRELCACEVIALLGLAPSTVSKHMAILMNADLVRGRKQGRWMYYSVPGRDAPPVVRRALAWVWSATAEERADMEAAVRALTCCGTT